MNTPLSTLEKYAEAFRELVNARVWGSKESPHEALRLNDSNDWEFICVAMDVVGDASLALYSFLRFGLEGPTRYEDFGERYLRLYGVLSASYLQQEAVMKLYTLMNCPNPKVLKENLGKLEIRTLRHQIASHSVDYRPKDGADNQSFVPVRIGLYGFTCTVTEGRGGSTHVIQLDKSILEHINFLITVLDKIYEKSIVTLFKGQADRIPKFQKTLEDLRFVRDGNFIFKGGDTDKPIEIRVLFATPRKEHN